MNIIVVGAGKASFLHFNSYYKLSKSGSVDLDRIYFLDKTCVCGDLLSKFFSTIGRSYKVHDNIENLISETGILPQDTIVDLCTPSGTFIDIIRVMKQYGFDKYIVEKPFFFENEEDTFNTLEGLKVIKIENYLYSKVYKKINYLIAKYHLELRMAITNFSKNRCSESLKARAFKDDNSPPSVFEIEIPHQLYICDDLFGNLSKLLYVDSNDMIVEKKVIKNHGQGVIIGENSQGNLYIHYSNLCANRTFRYMDFFFKKDYYLHAIYAPICEDGLGVQAGVVLSHENRIIESYAFNDGDDNMLSMLSHAIICFVENKTDKFASWESILLFSNLMKDVLAASIDLSKSHLDCLDYSCDPIQLWLLQLFSRNDKNNLEHEFLKFMEKLKIRYFSNIELANIPVN